MHARIVLIALAAVVVSMPAVGSDVPVLTSPWGGYQFRPPQGWSCEAPARSSARTSCTRIGPMVHAFETDRVYRQDVAQTLGVDLKQPIAPLDLARRFAEARIGEDPTVKVEGTHEILLGGVPGFRVEMAHKHPNGLNLRTVVWGAGTPDGLYLFIFRSPLIELFDADLPRIEEAIRTLKVSKPQRR